MMTLGVMSPQVGAAAPAEPPADYATAVFEAWVDGDETELRQRAVPNVAELLLARSPDDVDPGTERQCEGAAGSTFCSWALADGIQLVVRIDNAAASADEDQAAVEAFFTPVEPAIAIWPTAPGGFTQEVAESTQQSVDEGHSPWLLSPEAVIGFFGSTVLGWPEDIQEITPGDGEGAFRLVNTTTGAQVDVTLIQPVRQGEGGIWVMTRAGASGTPAEEPPDEPEPPAEPSPAPDEPSAPVAPPATPIPGEPDFTG